MTIEEIITTFENGNRFDSTIAINEYAKANNLGIGDVFREISYKILKWDASYKDRGFKTYVRMTVYYANNDERLDAVPIPRLEGRWYTP